MLGHPLPSYDYAHTRGETKHHPYIIYSKHLEYIRGFDE